MFFPSPKSLCDKREVSNLFLCERKWRAELGIVSYLPRITAFQSQCYLFPVVYSIPLYYIFFVFWWIISSNVNTEQQHILPKIYWYIICNGFLFFSINGFIRSITKYCCTVQCVLLYSCTVHCTWRGEGVKYWYRVNIRKATRLVVLNAHLCGGGGVSKYSWRGVRWG